MRKKIMKTAIAVVMSLSMLVGTIVIQETESAASFSSAKSSTKISTSTSSLVKIAAKKKKAKKYIGKKLKKLVKAIGKYKSFKKRKSAVSGEIDGVAKYKGFTVYCRAKKKKKVWYVSSVN